MENDYRISAHKQYFVIAKEQRDLYEKYDREIQEAKSAGVVEEEVDETLNRVFDLYEKREKAAAIAITFAGMCLEAFLYDYAASNLGDGYVDKHLDKLDMTSKALVIPRIVCGNEIDKSGAVYEGVSQLRNDRNSLVHFKSKRFDLEDMPKASEFHDNLNKRNKDGVNNCIKAIELFVKELDRMHDSGDRYYQQVCVW